MLFLSLGGFYVSHKCPQDCGNHHCCTVVSVYLNCHISCVSSCSGIVDLLQTFTDNLSSHKDDCNILSSILDIVLCLICLWLQNDTFG